MGVDATLQVLIMAGPTNRHEPRWPALLALFAVGGLRLAIPSFLSFGADWLLLIVVSFLMIPTVLARRGGNLKLNQRFGYALNVVVTADMAWSLGLLIATLPTHKLHPQVLLRSAAALWITNCSTSHPRPSRKQMLAMHSIRCMQASITAMFR
jgi:hypothetical protein